MSEIGSAFVRIRPGALAKIWVTHRFTGFHAWPDAPPPRDYLSHSHRHAFHVRVSLHVEHDDREVEFHDLLSHVRLSAETLGKQVGYEIGPGMVRDLGAMSCEMIARNIAARIAGLYPGRLVECDVSEDGECGATATDRFDA